MNVPLDWYVATVVPSRTLLGPTHRLERGGVIASARRARDRGRRSALVLAWNVVRDAPPSRDRAPGSAQSPERASARARQLSMARRADRCRRHGRSVARAEHRWLLAREAAIKLIRPEADARSSDGVEEVRERFRREAQVLASMKSRHTIDIFDYGVTEAGVFYYVMELLDGLDLESLVVRFDRNPRRA